LTVERSLLTGLPPDRVSGSVAAFEFLYLSELTARQIAAPSLASPEVPKAAAAGGGHVLEPKPGLYRQVAVFDFQSLYPSLIRTFQIDPLGRLEPAETEVDSIRAPNGARFRRQQGILPALLDELFPRRAEAKERGDKVASQAIKILMNSFYGVLGTPGCRFHHNELANAITSFGREMLLWTKARIEEAGFLVLYGDTDSLFVATGEENAERAQEVATGLALNLNEDLTRWIETTWQVPSKMTLELEKVYLRLFLPPMRHSAAGARKRYVGLVEEEGRRRVVFTGMEAVRRDWTDLARRVQREIYRRLFQDQPVADFVRKAVEEVRAGKWDEELVYRKVLRKKLEAYTATSPPHVVAARKMKSKPRRLIRYVITRGGPEPASENQHPLDYEHYIAKQIRPVAEPVLQLQSLYFEKVIGDDRQMELF
jgi:DNA polymerase-2